jgi:hypothetical protein
LIWYQSWSTWEIITSFECIHKHTYTHTHTHTCMHTGREICSLSFSLSVYFMKCDIWLFFKNLLRIQVSLKFDDKNNMSHEDQYTFMIISHLLLLRMRIVSDKSCRGNCNTHFILIVGLLGIERITHFMFSNLFLKIVSFMRCCGKIIVSGCFGVVV